MAKKPSIIDQLNKLCDQVVVKTQKAKESYAQSEDKMLAFVDTFVRKLARKYCYTIKKYQEITGNYKMGVSFGDCQLMMAAYTHGFQGSNPSVNTIDYVDATLLSRHGDSNDEMFVITGTNRYRTATHHYVGRGNTRFNERLAALVKYIKSGQFDKDFVQKVTDACKNRMDVNKTLNKTARRNNNI